MEYHRAGRFAQSLGPSKIRDIDIVEARFAEPIKGDIDKNDDKPPKVKGKSKKHRNRK